jgi:hypothetical protein
MRLNAVRRPEQRAWCPQAESDETEKEIETEKAAREKAEKT